MYISEQYADGIATYRFIVFWGIIKIKHDSGSIYTYVNLKLWYSCEIDVNEHNLIFVIEFEKKEQFLRYFYFCKALFREKDIRENKVNSTSSQDFSTSKNSSFCKSYLKDFF